MPGRALCYLFVALSVFPGIFIAAGVASLGVTIVLCQPALFGGGAPFTEPATLGHV